jgi:hypothetical protein
MILRLPNWGCQGAGTTDSSLPYSPKGLIVVKTLAVSIADNVFYLPLKDYSNSN